MDENLNTPVEDVTSDNPAEEKTFTQAEVNDLISKRLLKSEKSIFSKLGIDKKEDIDGLTEKLKDYETVKTRNSELESTIGLLQAEKEKAKYIRVLEKQNVDDEVLEFVYSKVEPKKDEKVEDYKSRAEEYLANHTNFIKGDLKTIDTSVNLSGKSTSSNPNIRMNNFIRGKE